VANVVFPTGIDRRDDLGLPRFEVCYGMLTNEFAWLASTSLFFCRWEKSLIRLLAPVTSTVFDAAEKRRQGSQSHAGTVPAFHSPNRD
jgi:hypothetical protein